MGQFDTTRWTIILKARSDETTVARQAYVHLCTTYWRPLYAFFRSKGVDPDEARDLTQELLTRLVERQSLETVTPEKGRFRSFLLKSAENLLIEEWRRQRAQKRIPREALISLDLAEAEELYSAAHADGATPEELFDREWAVTVLRSAFDAVREIYEGTGRGERFAAFSSYLTSADDGLPYQQLAEATGMTPGAVKAAVHRLRLRFRRCISEHVADTVASEAEWEEEMRHLLRLFEQMSPQM